MLKTKNSRAIAAFGPMLIGILGGLEWFALAIGLPWWSWPLLLVVSAVFVTVIILLGAWVDRGK